MADDKEFTYSEVSSHSGKKDLQIVVHDKIYNATSFVDEHPYDDPKPSSTQDLGGEEVLLDVGGQDATEAFEDVGHSDEAREILDGLKVGKLKRMPGDPEPKAVAQDDTPASSSSGGSGIGMYAVMLVGVLIAIGAYQYLQSNKDK
ncbi:MAG: hypothetical protein M1828_007224 [Chrysothrix sp. TS-e1954]|nr:MAG: hypothetical protein M1828_007224 [Chrysothrix sp. TS-e1954]